MLPKETREVRGMVKDKFPKEIFVFLEHRGGTIFDIEARDSLDGAAHGLSPGESMNISTYVLKEKHAFTVKLHRKVSKKKG
jgi:hypothetical protein